eukprot:scaffold86102_cov57-Phaeocystis_antarctica.AAC.1
MAVTMGILTMAVTMGILTMAPRPRRCASPRAAPYPPPAAWQGAILTMAPLLLIAVPDQDAARAEEERRVGGALRLEADGVADDAADHLAALGRDALRHADCGDAARLRAHDGARHAARRSLLQHELRHLVGVGVG